MLQRDNRLAESAPAMTLIEPHDRSLFSVQAISRHRWLIVSSVGICILLGVIYLLQRPAAYTAVAQLLIDNKVLQLNQQNAMFAASHLDLALVHNQIRILRSQSIAKKVIANLELLSDPEFQTPHLLDAASHQSWALDAFENNLSVVNLGASHTIEIRYTASEPENAARITNEITRVYLEEQAASNARAAQLASAWLRDRISALGTNARVISEASPPTRRAGQSNASIIVASAFAGLMLGIGGAFLRDLLSRTIGVAEEAAQLSATSSLGVLPRMRRGGRVICAPAPVVKASQQEQTQLRNSGESGAIEPVTRSVEPVALSATGTTSAYPNEGVRRIRTKARRLVAVQPEPECAEPGGSDPDTQILTHPAGAMPDERRIQRYPSAFSWSRDFPLSQFAHTIRRVRIVAETARQIQGAQAFGVISVLPGEGRTVVAANLAYTLAQCGRTLLVDAVPYNATLSRSHGAVDSNGLIEVLDGDAVLQDIVLFDGQTGLHFLPLGVAGHRDAFADRLWSEAMQEFVRQARSSYDYVVFDLPPLEPVPDVRAAAQVIDSFLLVVETGRISPDALLRGLAAGGRAADKLLGVVVNKARTSYSRAKHTSYVDEAHYRGHSSHVS